MGVTDGYKDDRSIRNKGLTFISCYHCSASPVTRSARIQAGSRKILRVNRHMQLLLYACMRCDYESWTKRRCIHDRIRVRISNVACTRLTVKIEFTRCAFNDYSGNCESFRTDIPGHARNEFSVQSISTLPYYRKLELVERVLL